MEGKGNEHVTTNNQHQISTFTYGMCRMGIVDYIELEPCLLTEFYLHTIRCI